MMQARQACEAWKKEAAMAKQKADMALKEKEAALTKLNALQKEVILLTYLRFSLMNQDIMSKIQFFDILRPLEILRIFF